MLWLACTVESLQNFSDSLNIFHSTFFRKPFLIAFTTRSHNTCTSKSKNCVKFHNTKNAVKSS